MPYQSTQGLKIADRVLTQFAHGYRNGQFVGDVLLPTVYVDSRSGLVQRFNEDELFLHELQRNPGDDIRQLTGDWGSDRFNLIQEAIAEKVPIEHIQETEAAGLPVNMQQRAVFRAMNRLALNKDYRQMQIIGNVNNYLPSNRLALAGATQWSDPTSDPIAQIDAAQQAMLNASGVMANVGVLSLNAANALRRHPLIRDMYKFVMPGMVPLDLIASAFHLKKLVIASAKYKLPSAPSTKVEMLSNSVALGYNPNYGDSADELPELGSPLPSVNSRVDRPSFGYTYMLRDSLMIEQPYYEKSNRSWIFPAVCDYQPVLTGVGAGYLFTNVAA